MSNKPETQSLATIARPTQFHRDLEDAVDAYFVLQRQVAEAYAKHVAPIAEQLAIVENDLKRDGGFFVRAKVSAWITKAGNRLVRSQATVMTYDSAGLEASTSKYVWSKITKRVVDKDRLKAAITLGILKPAALAFVGEKTNAPYLTATPAEPKPEIPGGQIEQPTTELETQLELSLQERGVEVPV